MNMTVYVVLCLTDQNNPWVEMVTEFKSIADFECSEQQRKGIKSVVVEKRMNRECERR